MIVAQNNVYYIKSDYCDELRQYNVQGRTRRQSETRSIGSSKYKNLKLKKEEEEE